MKRVVVTTLLIFALVSVANVTPAFADCGQQPKVYMAIPGAVLETSKTLLEQDRPFTLGNGSTQCVVTGSSSNRSVECGGGFKFKGPAMMLAMERCWTTSNMIVLWGTQTPDDESHPSVVVAAGHHTAQKRAVNHYRK